jgi:hypothetical protein
MALSPGYLYCKGKPWAFEQLLFKGDTLHAADGHAVDWYSIDFCWPDGNDSGEADDTLILDIMLETGESRAMRVSQCRDGCFDDDDVFMVFEQDDLLKVRSMIDEALK